MQKMPENSRTIVNSGTVYKTAIYARTSREFKTQEKVSIQQQINDGKELIRRLGLPSASVETILIDENRSGKLPPKQWDDLASKNRYGKHNRQRREGFSKIIELVTTGKIKAVVCRKRNRLMRGFLLHRRFWELCRQYQVKVYCTHETSIDATTNDETQEFNADIQALLAEFLLKQISTDIRAAKKYLKDNGRKSAPIRSIGYKDVKGGAEIVPEQAEAVKQIFELFISGKNFNQIASFCNNHWKARAFSHSGVTRAGFTVASIRKVLENPAYIGMTHNSENGLIASQCYKPIVDIELFRKAQERLSSLHNARFGSRYTPHLFGGILRCKQCDSILNCKISKDHRTRKIVDHVYHCVNRDCQKGDKASGIREMEYASWARRFLSVEIPPIEVNSNEINEAVIRRANIQNNLDELFQDPDMPIASSKKWEKTYREALNILDAKIRDLNQRSSCNENNKQWEEMDILERRQRILELVQSITVGKNWVIVCFKTDLRYNPGLYAELLIDDEMTDAEQEKMLMVPRAFPIFGIRGRGTNFSKRLVPPDVFNVIFAYKSVIIDGIECLTPDWEEAYSADDKGDLIVELYDLNLS